MRAHHHPHSKTRSSRLMMSFAALALIAMLIGTIDWGTAIAQSNEPTMPVIEPILDDAPDTSPNQPLPVTEMPQGTESPTEEPMATEVATESPTEEPVATEIATEQPGATEAPPATEPIGTESPDESEVLGVDVIGPTIVVSDDSGVVHILKYTCPEGYNTAGAGFALLEEECRADAELTSFTVTDAAGYSSTQAARLTRPPFMQQADFNDVPAAPISIAETILPGYGEPIVYCSVDARVVADWILQPVIGGNAVSWNLAAGTAVDCFFFNIQTDHPTPATGSVFVSKYFCPADVAPASDAYTLSEQCREEEFPVTFMVLAGETYAQSQTAAPGVPQQAEFTDVPFGEIGIVEVVPEGYGEPLAFCADIAADGPGAYAPVEVLPGNAVAVEHREDAEIPLTCIFFNFEEAADGNSLLLTKYDCPAGTSPDLGLPDLGTTCTVMPDVSFAIIYGDSGAYGNSDGAGSVQWDGIPAGLWTVHENIPEGYGEPVVFCGPRYETETPRVPVTAGEFTGEFTGTDELTVCTVFNFQDGVPSDSVTVVKYTCPAGVERGDVAYTLSEQCLEEVTPVTFRVFNGADFSQFQTATAGVPQYAEFTDVPFGELAITEMVPVGYGEPLVFCTDTPADGPGAYEPIPIFEGGTIVLNRLASAELPLTCLFFNFPDDDGSSLSVIKHTCPPGYDLEAASADPYVDCPTLTDGVTFNLTGTATDTTAVTGDAGSGMVQFVALAPGEYVLTETVPADTALSFVAECFGNDVGAVRPYPLATGDTLSLSIHAGEEISCHWFNVPDHDDTSLTVQKYTCATSTYVSDVDCQVYEHGKGFDLVRWNGDAWEIVATATTDGFGRATFGPIEPGEYWLDEHHGEWCHLTSAQLSADGTWLSVTSDAETVVNVYNCDGTPGKPGDTPTSFPNTGVPPSNLGTPWSHHLQT